MNRTALIVTALIVTGPLVFAQDCQEQVFLHLDDLDPNRVALDPASGQRLLLGRMKGRAGEIVTLSGSACDPDGDDLILIREDTGQEIAKDPNTGIWSLALVWDEPGLYYFHVTCNDGQAVNGTRRGTYAVEITVNRPPVLCGGAAQ